MWKAPASQMCTPLWTRPVFCGLGLRHQVQVPQPINQKGAPGRLLLPAVAVCVNLTSTWVYSKDPHQGAVLGRAEGQGPMKERGQDSWQARSGSSCLKETDEREHSHRATPEGRQLSE